MKISIIVPCYNQAKYLNDALQSVFDQSYTNWECIIVNDGSSDDTDFIAREWLAKDVRYKYIFQANNGLSNARNVGINFSRGDYIQFLDADDCLNTEKLSKSLSEIQDHSDLNIVISNFKMFNDSVKDDLNAFCELNKEFLSYEEILYGWDFKFNIPIHCGFFSSSLFDGFRFPESLKAKEDWIMWLVFFQKKVSAVFINEILVYYRTHENSMTKNLEHMSENTIKTLQYLDLIIPQNDYKAYLLYFASKQMLEINNLREKIKMISKRVITSNNSIGFKIEKKIRSFFKK